MKNLEIVLIEKCLFYFSNYFSVVHQHGLFSEKVVLNNLTEPEIMQGQREFLLQGAACCSQEEEEWGRHHYQTSGLASHSSGKFMWPVFFSVLRSRNYLFPAPAPTPAPAIYCHLKLYCNSSNIGNKFQWRFFFILASSTLTTVNIYLKDNFGSGPAPGLK